MLDNKKEIVAALSSILPIYYEYFRDDKAKFPCITYREYRNEQDSKKGSTVVWSNIGYNIKIWAGKVEDITKYAQQIDSVLRTLGYRRVSSQEYIQTNQICKSMQYLIYEEEHFK